MPRLKLYVSFRVDSDSTTTPLFPPSPPLPQLLSTSCSIVGSAYVWFQLPIRSFISISPCFRLEWTHSQPVLPIWGVRLSLIDFLYRRPSGLFILRLR